jgi:hypothetical protein
VRNRPLWNSAGSGAIEFWQLIALKAKLLIIDTALKSSVFGFAGGCFYMTIKGRHLVARWCSGWSTQP